MSRKRDKAYASRHVPYFLPKRRRPLPPAADDDQPENPSVKLPTAVVVTGLSQDCSVLDLKSRFEIYGSISRTRMDPTGVAYITFRSNNAAESAISASLDPSFGITLNSNSNRVQVTRAGDPVPQWREGVRQKDGSSSVSRLLRAEVPLSRHGRGNKLGSAIVNPRVDNVVNNNDNKKISGGSGLEEVGYKGREIVAYDDIL